MGYNRDTFSLVLARDGMKLPAGNLTFLRIKIGSDGRNLPSEWIANSEAGIVLIFNQIIKFIL